MGRAMAGWTWEQVVPMMDRGTTTGRGYGALQEVRAYWQGLRNGGGLPGRASIDPRGMQGSLEHVFLIERIAPGEARFRLAGMHLTLLIGMEVRGMPLSVLFEPPARDAVQALVEAVFVGPATVELALEAERGIGRPALEGRMLLLPVIGDEGICDRALGCVVTQGEIGRSPRRFAISRQTTAPIAPHQPAALVARAPVDQPGFAEQVLPFSARAIQKPGKPRAHPHLRLVKSDD